MIANKIKPKILKVINKFPTHVTIYRNTKNEFGEPVEEQKVCSVTGFYHEGNTQMSFITADKGEFKKDKSKYLMVVCDDTTSKIQEGDYLYLDEKRFYIKDLGNQNRLNIYFDMLLQNG